MLKQKMNKKVIFNDWQNLFPQLVPYSKNKLYKVVGPLVIGIELIKLPHVEEYRPYFVIYPLWGNKLGNNINDCLSSPVILSDIRNKKGLQFDIPYSKHGEYFAEAVECTKKQIQIPFNKDVILNTLFGVVNGCFKDKMVNSNAGQQAKLFQFEFYAALYVNNNKQLVSILNQIQKESKHWNMELFELWFGNFEHWLMALRNKVNFRNEFMNQIKTNQHDKKIEKLYFSELIDKI